MEEIREDIVGSFSMSGTALWGNIVLYSIIFINAQKMNIVI